MPIELLIHDPEDHWEVYDLAEEIITEREDGEEIDRVYLLGDISDRTNKQELAKRQKKYLSSEDIKVLQQYNQLDQQINAIIQRHQQEGARSIDEIIQQFTPQEAELVKLHHRMNEKVEGLQELLMKALKEESAIRYAKHNKHVVRLKEEFDVEVYGIVGNRDPIWAKEMLPALTIMFREDQPLEEEGIIGAASTFEYWPDGAPEPYSITWPNSEYYDDSPNDENDSFVWKEYKDKDLDLIVTHKGGNYGRSMEGIRKMNGAQSVTGIGIDKLGRKNRCVEYSGHIDSTYIYRDPESNVLTIRPGRNYHMVVHRDGKDVEKIEVYRIIRDAPAATQSQAPRAQAA